MNLNTEDNNIVEKNMVKNSIVENSIVGKNISILTNQKWKTYKVDITTKNLLKSLEKYVYYISMHMLILEIVIMEISFHMHLRLEDV